MEIKLCNYFPYVMFHTCLEVVMLNSLYFTNHALKTFSSAASNDAVHGCIPWVGFGGLSNLTHVPSAFQRNSSYSSLSLCVIEYIVVVGGAFII